MPKKCRMRRGVTTLYYLLIMLAAVSGILMACGDSKPLENEEDPTSELPEASEHFSGVTLGIKQADVRKLLGENYIVEAYEDDAGYLREQANQWIYENGIDLLIGQTSQEVMQIRVFSSDIKTKLGVAVGDNAMEAFNIYRKQYDEHISRHTEGKLDGWFDIDGDMVLIFDTNKDDYHLVNDPILPDSKIEAIYLKYHSSID